MHLEFYGAAEQVTGSLHRVCVGDRSILLDCGLFQGRRAETRRLNRQLPRWASDAHCVVLSHAHLDHSGSLPTLVKNGFEGNIYCTHATRDLCSALLRDAAMLQEQDARYLNRRYAKEGRDEKIESLYTIEDAQRAVSHMVSMPLRRPMTVAPGVKVTFHNAGHVLGSALVQLDLTENGKHRRILFTGDLGREELPLLQPPDIVEGVECLIMESTYGDRAHPDIASLDENLAKIVNETIEREGRVYIPTFALERAQEVLFALRRLHDNNKIPMVPIYIDSPLAVAITEIYKLHPTGLSRDVQDRINRRADPFSPPGMSYVTDVESSKSLQRSGRSCIVIAGSGMCEGGRIVHHLKGGLEDRRNSIVIVGFMAQHTLGRRLVERRSRVRLFGVERDVRAQVHVLNGLSAHADKDDLLSFAKQTARKGRIEHVVLVHGEEVPRLALEEQLNDAGIQSVVHARKGETLKL